MKRLFAALSLLALAVVLVAVWRDREREWKQVQARYYELAATLEKDPDQRRQILESPLEIKQIQTEVGGRVDRCVACHLGVDNPRFETMAQPYRTHPKLEYLSRMLRHSLDEFGCSICHDGQGLATSKESAHGRIRYWDRPLLQGKWLDIGCGRCHKGTLPLEGAPVLSGGRRLAKQVGCHNCHKMEGFEQERQGAFGPSLAVTGLKVDSNWLQGWLKDPFSYKAKTKMLNFYLSDEEALPLTEFLVTMKGRRSGEDVSPEENPEIAQGRKLFRELKCFFCHETEGFAKEDMAPDLTGFGNKHAMDLDFGYVRDTPCSLRDWTMRKIREPRAFETKETKLQMPGNDLTEDEIAALTVLLLGFTGEEVPKAYRRREVFGADEGKRLFDELACVGCHNAASFGIKGGREENVAKDLSTIGDKVNVTWMVQWIKDPASFNPDTKMPALGPLAENQVLHLTGYVMSFRRTRAEGAPDRGAGETSEPASLSSILEGRGVFETLQCYRCHRVAGRGGEIAPELTRVGEKVQRGWLLEWLAQPENFNLNMLDDRPIALSETELTHLVNYLFSLGPGPIHPPSIPPDALLVRDKGEEAEDDLQRGRRLFGEAGPVQYLFGKRVGKMGLGCHGCHRLDGRGGDIGPDLTVEGDKVNREWLSRWLKNPKTYVRNSRMGDFHLTDEEAGSLADYLMGRGSRPLPGFGLPRQAASDSRG